ncbi:MAG: DUF4177 domain-containing protein [Tissierellia bacterium]|nr:DUF4177 domain-containing protein [Tissierellia bacterium]
MYEYKYIDIDSKSGIGKADMIEEIKKTIDIEAKNGWRLSQILPVPNEKFGVYAVKGYTVIFEKLI